MEKTSKVVGVQGNGTFANDYGTFYKWEVDFENGDSGQYNSKTETQSKFVMGQDAKYTLTSREHNGNTYYTVKPFFDQNTPGGGKWQPDPLKDARITRMAVLKAAVELAAAGKINTPDVLAAAGKFEAWVNEAKAVAAPAPVEQVIEQVKETIASITGGDDGLPF